MGILRYLSTSTKNELGRNGEARVRLILSPRVIGNVERRFLYDFFLLDDHGRSHQIDHIEIRHNGIFCLEVKHLQGEVFGDENDTYWRQIYPSGQRKNIPNPLIQNRGHVRRLEEALGHRYKVHSLIVMSRNNGIIHSSHVVNLGHLPDYLDRFDDGTHYTTEEMDRIYEILLSKKADISLGDHIASVKGL